MTTVKQLQAHIKEQDMEIFDLIAKITGILKKHDLWDDNDQYEFDDGDRWARFEPEQEDELIEHSQREKEDNDRY